MPKELMFGAEARAKLAAGAHKVVDAVSATLGPKGRNAVLDRGFGAPQVTKDGVTVARSIELADRAEEAGARIIREAASKVGDIAGDATTTATVIAGAILDGGLKALAEGSDAQALREGIETAARMVAEEIGKKAESVDGRLSEIAAIAANDPELGKRISDAFEKIGKDGVLTVEEGSGFETVVETVDGMRIQKGYLSPYFATNEKGTCELENVKVYVTDKKVSNGLDAIEIMRLCGENGFKAAVIIADDIDGDALATFVANRMRGTFVPLCIKAPGFGEEKEEVLKDLCILFGARLVSEKLGNRKAQIGDLGSVRKVTATKDHTTFVGCGGDESRRTARIAEIKSLIETEESDFAKGKLKDRVARLAGAVGVIKIGALTDASAGEVRDRVEDAIESVQSALAEGVVIGGGKALAEAATAVHTDGESKSKGWGIVYDACFAPIIRIAANAGMKATTEDVRGMGPGMGIDAAKLETNVDLKSRGIIDPAKAVKAAMLHGSAAALSILMAETLVIEKKEDEKKD